LVFFIDLRFVTHFTSSLWLFSLDIMSGTATQGQQAQPVAQKSGSGTWIAGCAILFITFLSCCSMMLDQGLFDYYEQVRHAEHRQELQRSLGFTLTPNAIPGSLRPERMKSVRNQITGMFNALPKNRAGRMSAEVMRYVAHRYFSHRHAWFIKGFEPHKDPVKDSTTAALSGAHILKSRVPGYCESSLEGSLALSGFSLDDATTLLAGVEQLIFDETVAATESAYWLNHLPVSKRLSKQAMLEVVHSVIIETMLEGNFSNPRQHASLKKEINQIYPPWNSARIFIDDLIEETAREKSQSRGSTMYMRASQYQYGFEETAQVTTRVTEEFGPWVNYECNTMKETLSAMDVHGTGRVKLSDFWHDGKEGWQFKESAEYLRSLGALDETDTSLGPQVLIPNYVYAASNCIMSTPSYSICCLNTCEDHMRLLEKRLETPDASPDSLMQAVEMLLPPLSQKSLNGTLRGRLDDIAAGNEGNLVPIHGRLFAQWLHYAFPRDCPYPHEVGTLDAKTLGEWVDAKKEIEVMDEEILNITLQPHALLPPSPHAGAKMWSAKEELLSSSTASDGWAAVWMQSALGMILALVMLITVVRAVRSLRQVRTGSKATDVSKAASTTPTTKAEQS